MPLLTLECSTRIPLLWLLLLQRELRPCHRLFSHQDREIAAESQSTDEVNGRMIVNDLRITSLTSLSSIPVTPTNQNRSTDCRRDRRSELILLSIAKPVDQRRSKLEDQTKSEANR